ncbi:MAG: hypothetical protein KZQ58_06250 [gamma proteobacterium symbiont of Bathyaustriella thionipta]|nr:hypothetical protein [gamma proteobacterium symbiont of Bathyaustriella thionipta]
MWHYFTTLTIGCLVVCNSAFAIAWDQRTQLAPVAADRASNAVTATPDQTNLTKNDYLDYISRYYADIDQTVRDVAGDPTMRYQGKSAEYTAFWYLKTGDQAWLDLTYKLIQGDKDFYLVSGRKLAIFEGL